MSLRSDHSMKTGAFRLTHRFPSTPRQSEPRSRPPLRSLFVLWGMIFEIAQKRGESVHFARISDPDALLLEALNKMCCPFWDSILISGNRYQLSRSKIAQLSYLSSLISDLLILYYVLLIFPVKGAKNISRPLAEPYLLLSDIYSCSYCGLQFALMGRSRAWLQGINSDMRSFRLLARIQ